MLFLRVGVALGGESRRVFVGEISVYRRDSGLRGGLLTRLV